MLATVSGPMVTTTALPPATPGTPYSFQLAASGTSGTVTWKKLRGLPSGMRLTSAGLVTGTPSLRAAARVYKFRLGLTEVTAAGSVTVTATLPLDLT